jgi:segregation and condensation protein A
MTTVEQQTIESPEPIVVPASPSAEVPADLYIPSDPLEIILADFNGPLDLLLYLIKRQNIDILDIPIAEITRQYMTYIDLMQEMRFELAAEYLLISAMLAEIKSRMLLPRQLESDEDEVDPRAELVRRLQAYEYYKQVAEELDQLPRQGRDVFNIRTNLQNLALAAPNLPDVTLDELNAALQDVLQRVATNADYQIRAETLSIRERMSAILAGLHSGEFNSFQSFFNVAEGRMGVVVTFIAILELVKQSMIDIIQTETYGTIHIKVCGGD